MDVLTVGPLQPQEERLVRFGVELESAGPNGFELSMESDNLEDDNRAYLALDVPEKVKVLIVEGSSESALPGTCLTASKEWLCRGSGLQHRFRLFGLSRRNPAK